MAEDKKELILRVLKQFPEEKFSVAQLQGMIKSISYPTLLKWISVLEAEKKIRVDDYGNIKFVYVNKEFLDAIEREGEK